MIPMRKNSDQKYLDFRYNQLTSLPKSVEGLPNIKELYLGYNQLTSFPENIATLPSLTHLSLTNNNIKSLPESFFGLTGLLYLNLDCNNLTSIPKSIDMLTGLVELYLSGNKLTTLPSQLANLRNLRYLYYNNNPTLYIPPNVLRITTRNTQNVYGDAQSVHNSDVQKSLSDSINRILTIQPKYQDVIPIILEDAILTPSTKASLVEYAGEKDIHTLLDLSFSDVLIAVWNRIIDSPYSEDIKKTLNTEMQDAECKCFTGRISRLVNCLSGYDELVEVKISDSEQIGAVIELVKNRLSVYTVEEHQIRARIELSERGFDENIIELWIGYIEE
jgi:Leucine-rich repeat (LRR) protein